MSVYMVRGYHSNLAVWNFCVSVHGARLSQQFGCVEFLCQCTWCEVITAILAVWNFCVSVHGARLSQQFWLCGISVSVYMVRGYHSNSGCVEFLCQCTWCEVLTAILAVWNFCVSVHGARFSQQFWLCNFCVSVHGARLHSNSGCVEFLCQCTWCEVITAILAVWNFCVSVHGARLSQQFGCVEFLCQCTWCELSQQFWLCGISVSVYMVRGYHSNSGCVEFLCQCTWCENHSNLAVWNFCVSVHGARLSQQFWLCGISVVHGARLSQQFGCRGFLCVHGTGFSQDSGCVEFLCQCTWCENHSNLAVGISLCTWYRVLTGFWLCGISVSVYMVRGYHSNSGCRGFLCVHGTGFSQQFWLCGISVSVYMVRGYTAILAVGISLCTWYRVLTGFWLCGISVSVYMVRGYHSNSGCVEFLCQCTWCEVITAILAVWNFCVSVHGARLSQQFWLCGISVSVYMVRGYTAILAVWNFCVSVHGARLSQQFWLCGISAVHGANYHSNSGCVEFLCQCTWCEVITAILLCGISVSVYMCEVLTAIWLCGISVSVYMVRGYHSNLAVLNFCVSVHGARLSQQFWLCGISVYMVRGYHSNSGCVEFLCQCTWCEVITAILAVWNFCVSVHGARLSQQFWLCGISVSVYMVRGYHSNSGCRGFLCTWCENHSNLAVWNFCVSVHGARFSQQFWLCGISVSVYMVRGYHSNSGCRGFLCQCTWCEVITAILAVWNFCVSVHGARLSQQFWLCGISVSVYMVRGYHSNSGCVEFLCQCTWCEVITAILAVWNFCVSVHGARFSQQFWL